MEILRNCSLRQGPIKSTTPAVGQFMAPSACFAESDQKTLLYRRDQPLNIVAPIFELLLTEPCLIF